MHGRDITLVQPKSNRCPWRMVSLDRVKRELILPFDRQIR